MRNNLVLVRSLRLLLSLGLAGLAYLFLCGFSKEGGIFPLPTSSEVSGMNYVPLHVQYVLARVFFLVLTTVLWFIGVAGVIASALSVLSAINARTPDKKKEV
jgi:hypothetical protein